MTNQQTKQKKGPRFKPIKCWSDALSSFFFFFFFPGSSYSKRGGQTDNRSAGEDSGRKGSSGSSTTKVPASPLASSDRKKSATPSTVRPNTHTADIFAFKPHQKHKGCICVIAWYTHKFPNMRTSNCCVCRAVIFAL